MSEQPRCELCGEPMPPGEEMFKYHGYSGACPKPPLTAAAAPAPEGLDAIIRAWAEQNPHGLSVKAMPRFAAQVADAALRTRPALSDETLREMAEACKSDLLHGRAFDLDVLELMEFARAVLARQQEEK